MSSFESPSAPRKADDPEQPKPFLEKAREIEAVEEHSPADKLMEPLAKTPPQKRGKRRDE
jgi:hypothetical protein